MTTMTHAKSLILMIGVDESQPVEVWQFGHKDSHQRRQVDDKVSGVVLGVETGQHEQHDGDDGQEFTSNGKSLAVINLFPMCQRTGLPLILWLERRSFQYVQKHQHACIVDDIGQGPCLCCGQHRNAEEDQVQEEHSQCVRKPKTFTVQPRAVGIHIPMTAY